MWCPASSLLLLLLPSQTCQRRQPHSQSSHLALFIRFLPGWRLLSRACLTGFWMERYVDYAHAHVPLAHAAYTTPLLKQQAHHTPSPPPTTPSSSSSSSSSSPGTNESLVTEGVRKGTEKSQVDIEKTVHYFCEGGNSINSMMKVNKSREREKERWHIK